MTEKEEDKLQIKKDKTTSTSSAITPTCIFIGAFFVGPMFLTTTNKCDRPFVGGIIGVIVGLIINLLVHLKRNDLDISEEAKKFWKHLNDKERQYFICVGVFMVSTILSSLLWSLWDVILVLDPDTQGFILRALSILGVCTLAPIIFYFLIISLGMFAYLQEIHD
jgi:hypothetical protein